MHRQSHEEVAAAARRRLELLGRELDRAGLRRVDELEGPGDTADTEDTADTGDTGSTESNWNTGNTGNTGSRPDLPAASTVPPVGRHLRPPRPGMVQRLGGGVRGWVGDQVPETLRGRVGLDPGPVLLVVALVALAVTATAFVVLRMGGDAEAVQQRAPSPTGAASPLVPLSSPAVSGSPGAGSGSGSGSVTVDISGKVRRPGVATLPAGSRVVDALKRAGGARGRVDLSPLNLARVLVDGEQILVGRAASGGIAAGASTAAPDATGVLVNINTATAEQLDTLPGVGPVTAQKILDWRTANGAFSSVDELMEVDGIGEKTLADLAPLVTL